MAESFSILTELALRAGSAIANKRLSGKTAKRVVVGWANWYLNRLTVFRSVETESEERLIEFRKNLQWMGDQMTQQLGALRDNLDRGYWNKANSLNYIPYYVVLLVLIVYRPDTHGNGL